jgi:DNA helicase HerA-like ATPase
MLADEQRRGWVLKQVRDEDVLRFWTKEFLNYDKRLQSEAVAPPLNKLGAFLASPALRAVLTKHRPVLDAETCMARNRIVLARLSKGAVGEDGAHLLGGLLLGLFQRATMAREALPLELRKPFAMFVDEIGSFATKPFLELLAEARKYGVALTLATQSIAVMEPELRAGILGNVGQLVSFRVGAEDADLLEKEFAGKFGPQSLMQLDVGERIVKDGGRAAVIVSAA